MSVFYQTRRVDGGGGGGGRGGGERTFPPLHGPPGKK